MHEEKPTGKLDSKQEASLERQFKQANMKEKLIGQRGEELSLVNDKIDEALVALKALRSWINDPVQDAKTANQIEDWLFKLLIKIENISFELKHYQ